MWFLDNFGVVSPSDHFHVQFREHLELIRICNNCKEAFTVCAYIGENSMCLGCGSLVLRYKK